MTIHAEANRLLQTIRSEGDALRRLAARDGSRAVRARNRHRATLAEALGALHSLGPRLFDAVTAEQDLLMEISHARYFSAQQYEVELRAELAEVKATIQRELDFLATIPES